MAFDDLPREDSWSIVNSWAKGGRLRQGVPPASLGATEPAGNGTRSCSTGSTSASDSGDLEGRLIPAAQTTDGSFREPAVSCARCASSSPKRAAMCAISSMRSTRSTCARGAGRRHQRRRVRRAQQGAASARAFLGRVHSNRPPVNSANGMGLRGSLLGVAGIIGARKRVIRVPRAKSGVRLV